jgi:hypothetical protein
MKQQNYTKTQIIHSFSFSSNSGFGKIFKNTTTCQKSYEQLQQFVRQVSKEVLSDKTTQQYIGADWKTVWGPVVFTNDQNSSFAVADNTMGMYYSPSNNLFIIAIAGTNAISSFGWLKEDFHVNATAIWKNISGKGMGDISQGTATGLEIYTTDNEKEQLIRASLQHIASCLETYEFIIKCHRKYNINLRKVRSYERNAQRILLSLETTKHQIPVSKNYVKEVLLQLQKQEK